MNALYGPTLPPHLLSELAMHLRNTGSMLTVAQAATKAILAWMSANPTQAPDPEDPVPVQGYQWKTLFLPDGTEVRMSTREATYHARVVGDYIMFEGRRYSPRGFTLHIAGSGRNAWRDLWLRMPGERYYVSASRRRREQERVAAGLPANPAGEQFKKELADRAARNAERTAANPAPAEETATLASVPADGQAPSLANAAAGATANHAQTVAAAAITMSEALRTMLALMERLSARAMPEDDRRIHPARRQDDILADACAMD